MKLSLVARIVGFSSRHAGIIVLAMLLIGFVGGDYAVHHFVMDSRTETMISSQTQWRKREAVYDAAFPQQDQLIDVVVDGATPERAEEAAQALTAALRKDGGLFPIVRRPDDGVFFSHDGLLFLPIAAVKAMMQQEIGAQAFLGALAADPSLRGVANDLSSALLGVQHGQAKLEDLDHPMASLARTLDTVLEGKPAFLAWRSLVTGATPSLRETRRFIEVQPRLDFGELMPGKRATQAIRNAALRLGLEERNGVRVRLTGPVPMADDEFGSLVERVRLMATLMMVAVLAMLWFALRSARLIFAVLLMVFTGLAITTAAGLLAVGAFNLISVAFIALFVGLGVDFGIQFCVRYRAERYAVKDLDLALVRTGSGVGAALTLAAAATAAGFYSFLPTNYRGVAELGLVAGTGMMITFVLSITFLPALVKLLSPRGEAEDIGIRALAPLDDFIEKRKRLIVLVALVGGLAASSLLPTLDFDFNPLDLRNPKVESVATALELMKNPDTSPNTLEILAPSHAAATSFAARLSALPQVSQVRTVDSFVPDDQSEKLAIIADAQTLLDPTLNPFVTQPPRMLGILAIAGLLIVILGMAVYTIWMAVTIQSGVTQLRATSR
ncbi:MAG: MMPL family transporter, partial [Rhizomicrobium sp.]